MINLETFFKNHLDTKDVSDDKMKKFAEVHLQRITANNPGGIYTTRITATTTAYTNYFGAISNEDVKAAMQQGLSITMNEAYDNFVHTVQQKEGIIKGTWGKTSAQYQDFFPYGLNEYNEGNLSNIELLMNRMVAASTAHSAELPAGFVTLFTNLRTAFTDARTAQLAVIGEVAGLKDTSESNRNDLETQLMINILITGSNNVGHPERMTTYFDQSIIRRRRHADEPFEEEFDNTFLMAQVVNIPLPEEEIDPATLTFTFENPGTQPYRVYSASSETGEPGPASFFDVLPANVITKTGTELIADIGLGASTPLMNIKNIGAGEGHYRITISEE
jgi:hypothetical protein